MAHADTIAFTWESPEYIRNDRTVDWYWAVALLGLAGVVACVYFHNYFFGVVVLLSSILVILYAARPVPFHTVSVSQTGVMISDHLTNYEHIKSFWIENHPREGYKLLLKVETVMTPISVIPIADTVSINDLRVFMSEYTEEREMKEPILLQVFEAIF